MLPATAAEPSVEADDNVDLPPLPEGEIRSPDDLKAEEEYRKQALDYNMGHVAQPLADEEIKKKKASKGTSALLASLLQNTSQAGETKKEAQSVPIAVAAEQAPKLDSATKKAAPKVGVAKPSTKMEIDSDDEEETTMQLQSEFSSAQAPTPSATSPAKSRVVRPAAPAIKDDDDDVDDLAAAIKTKKKKKKKK